MSDDSHENKMTLASTALASTDTIALGEVVAIKKKKHGSLNSLHGLDYWTGLHAGLDYMQDWTTGLDYWTGLLDWTTGLDYWTGLHAELVLHAGLDYWTGLLDLDWTTGLDYTGLDYRTGVL